MTDIHMTAEILRALARGELDPGELEQIILTHLFELCPTCRAEFETFRDMPEFGESDGREYDAVFATLMARTPELAATVEEERERALRDFKHLLGLHPGDRMRRVKRANRRFQSPFLAQMLLEHARDAVPGDMKLSRQMAELAFQVAEHASAPLRHELQTTALAFQANALRSRGELKRSRALMNLARQRIRHEGIVETRLCAEVDWLEGLLARDQRRFVAGEALLNRSAMLYRFVEDDVNVARALISLGELLRAIGSVEEAIGVAERAAVLLQPHDEPRLLFYAVHNRLLYLAEAGRFQEARTGLVEHAASYGQFPSSHVQLRLSWLEAKIAQGLGEVELAEFHFQTAQAGFIEAGNGYDAALVTLDLAALYFTVGRVADVKRLAEEITPIFEAEDIHREAVAALILFQNAVRVEAASLAMVGELGVYLESVRRDPSLTFRKPS